MGNPLSIFKPAKPAPVKALPPPPERSDEETEQLAEEQRRQVAPPGGGRAATFLTAGGVSQGYTATRYLGGARAT
jgi:hypothetical protein